MNKKLFWKLFDAVPYNLDRSKRKEKLNKKIRMEVKLRDNNTCQTCGLKSEYGNPAFAIKGKLAVHHIIPNGKAELSNLITLCKYCHCALHMILYTTGKWRYVPMR